MAAKQWQPVRRSIIGSSERKIYHFISCEWAGEIPSDNLERFESAADARRRGYRACKVCEPRDTIVGDTK